MQPRPCTCTPMCELRTTNPMRLRQSRRADPTFAAASVFRTADPSANDLAGRLTRYAVLAHEPSVPIVAADYWLHSEPFYLDVMGGLGSVVTGEPEVESALARLVRQPDDTAAERRFENRLRSLLDRRPDLGGQVEGALDAADDNVYIHYFHGSGCESTASPVELDDVWQRAKSTQRPEPDRSGEIHVVIPLMDRTGTGRVRNLVACLLALRDQSPSAPLHQVTVVEYDTHPRWRHVIEPMVDRYIHVHGTGRFNKSWTVNVGVCQTRAPARLLCLLDADMVVDRDFLERNRARFDDPGHDAHLPHTECLSLDVTSTHRVIAQRCLAGEPEAPLPMSRGLLLRDAPGGCLWIRSELFHRIGGFDERYAGWGGEDEDMIVRTSAAGATVQYDDVMVHLAHERPPMRRGDGEPFNAHVPVGTWTGESGYGSLTGPATAGTS